MLQYVLDRCERKACFGGRREDKRRAGYRKPQVCAGWRVGGLVRGQRKRGLVEQHITGRLKKKGISAAALVVLEGSLV